MEAVSDKGENEAGRLSQVSSPMPGVEIAFERYAEGENKGKLTRIYIGTKWHGPVLSWTGEGWCNLYSRGNYGKNFICGGNWSAEHKKRFPTIAEALEHRDYVVTGLKMTEVEMREQSLARLEHLLEPILEKVKPEEMEKWGHLGEILKELEQWKP